MTRLALVFALLTACTNDTHVDPGPDEQTAEHRERFSEETGGNYSFLFSRACECLASSAGPFRIVVSNGNVVSATDGEGLAVSGEILAELPSISDIFDRIDEAYERPADSIEVEFDPATGYPAEVNIDYSEQVADEEYTVFVSEVTAE